ncbi:SDR family oxidoreductase [Corynebacterium caspium]|uniref:SDR family oxidoreductase n=1 Tax=Corynebacterium caspium TaxID=234828 RepID=UPI000363AF4E|nr:SDR family oxidoreductase [Corynebacterium caspium]WKD59748.1 Gluconate 5-dehydrogenase [Corynebacterium caspium DSM 44850]
MHHLFDITGKLALVTGANRGLGYILAEGLAAAGANVVLQGRNPEKIAAAAAKLAASPAGREVKVHQCVFDITDAAAANCAIAELVATHGTPDILVNNAGIQRRHPITEFPTAEWDEVISTNLSSAFYVTKPVAAAMVERGAGGKIIMIGSVQSRLARQTIAPYCASKGGLALLTQGMTADLARFNIQVNQLSPGYFATEMNTALVEDPEFDAWLRNRTPAGRWGNPEELIGTLLYLASPASSFVTGQNIFVDGGMTAVV